MARNWKRIVVAIGDPERRGSWALRKGAEIATRCGARLQIFHAYSPTPGLYSTFDPKTAEAIAHETLARQCKELERLARPLRRRGINVHTEVVWDYPPHAALVRYAVKQRADLLVAESHRHSRLARWFLTNADWELIRQCPCPLWFAKSPRLRPKVQVLAAVDPFHFGSKLARLDDRILGAARQVAKMFGGKLAVCHAQVPPAPYVGDVLGRLPAPAPLLPGQLRRHLATVRKATNQLARRFGVPTAARFVESGDPVVVLPRMTRRLRSDVLVMGAVSRSGLDHLFIGSTAERVIDNVTCDVLIVKPASFRAHARSRRRR